MRHFTLLASAACIALTASPAFAQATRTWVSGVGNDVNPCSRTAPCKTFAGALPKTAAGGEISVMDPGGFGGMTINKSISINGQWGGEAGVVASLITGFTINGPNAVVNLRGLMIEGAANGINGVRFLQGSALHIQNCTIRGFNSSSASAGNGVLIANSAGNPEIDITDSLIADNGAGGVGSGIAVQPTGSGGAHVSVTRTQVLNNLTGVSIDGDNSTGPINVSIIGSQVAGNTNSGLISLSPNNNDSVVRVMIDSSAFLANGTTGVQSAGQRSTVRIGRSTATGNGAAGLQANNGGVLQSYGDNMVDGNTSANIGVTPATPG